MVQKKYFGDSRDYFKYDIITSVVEEVPFREYVFIPMLTCHREDNEGKKKQYNIGSKRCKLYSFIQDCQDDSLQPSLKHWEKWLTPYINNYHTIEPVDETYFHDSDEQRRNYWIRLKHWINLGNALIFLDPDTGLETGKPSYLLSHGREKYLLNDELEYLLNVLAPTSTVMIYQQLQYNKNLREDGVENKLKQVRTCYSGAFICAYREDDLAFLFISKEKMIHNKVFGVLNRYHSRSSEKSKSIHEFPVSYE